MCLYVYIYSLTYKIEMAALFTILSPAPRRLPDREGTHSMSGDT